MNPVLDLWNENRFMTGQLQGRVLDAGSGPGNYTTLLREIPSIAEVISLDILLPLEEFWGKCSDAMFVRGTIGALPFKEGSFDSIFCWRVMQYAPDGQRVLSEFVRILRVGGLVMIRMPNDPEGRPPPHARAYLEELSQERREVFTWRTYWSPKMLGEEAQTVGLIPHSNTYFDRSQSQVRVFEAVK